MDTVQSSYLAENEPASSTENEGEDSLVYQPTEDEKKAIRLVQKLFDKSKKLRSKYDQKWSDYYQMFRGKQWKDQRPSYRSSEVINLIWQTIQSFVPIMTDSQPKIEYEPQAPEDIPVTGIINEVANYDWNRKNWGQVLVELLYDGHFYGNGLTQFDFDKDGDNGLGSIEFETLEPFYCYPDPNSSRINHKHSRFFMTAVPMDIDLIKVLYPTNGKYVKPDSQGLKQIPDKANLKELIYKSPTDSVIITNESPQTGADLNRAVLFTLFLKDDEYDEIESTQQHEDGSVSPKYTQKLKYPNGRIIQVANGVVLKDVESPIEDGFFPVQKYTHYTDPREFWGIGEIEQLESPQKLFNQTLCLALDTMRLCGNPIWIMDEGACDADNMVNKPGLIVEKMPGSYMERIPGVPLQPFVMELLQNFRQWHDAVSGSQDVSRGINPTGVTAARAIADLQQASQTRIRLKSRNLDAYLQEVGQHYLSYMFQNYTVPRVIRIAHKSDPALTKYFKFHISQHSSVEGETRKVVHISHYNQTPEGMKLGPETSYEIKGQFDVKVSTGSNLPFSKIERRQEQLELFDRTLVDQSEVLKNIDYPNWEAVVERTQEQQAQMAQQQPQQQQQKG